MFETILATSLLLNVAGGYLAHTFYGIIQASGERRISIFDRSPAPQHPDIVMLGDSITHEGNWSEHFPHYRILNRGISGDTTSDIVARLPQLYPLEPRAIFVMVGINDIARRVAAEKIQRNFQTIFDGLATHLPATEIYIQSVLPVGRQWPFPLNRAKIGELNQFLQEEAARRQYTYVDLWDTMATEQGELPRAFTNDGVHLMGAAYGAWSAKIKPHIAAVADPVGISQGDAVSGR